jgi:Flp pilus assembly protein CpaB
VPLRADNAAGGRLRPGDVVQVLATSNTGKPDSHTDVILPQATVYDVGSEDQSSVVSTNSNANVSSSGRAASWAALIVTQDQAIQLANARWNTDLDIALVPSQS